MSEVLRTSRCICGSVKLRLTGEPFAMAYCHCESCRLWFGAPVHSGSLWPTENVHIEKGRDLLATYTRTKGAESQRKFCQSCGAPVMVDHPSIQMIDIPAVSVRDLTFKPTLHSHYTERVLSIRDGLPKYKDFDPAVGGSGERVPE